MRSNKLVTLGAAAAIVVTLLGAGIWYQFFRDDAPPPASLDAAVESLGSTPSPETQGSPATAAGELDGQWVIVSLDDLFAGYRIGEELASIGTSEAVGRTSIIEGQITIAGMVLTSAIITVDMTTLQSDESRRDNTLRSQALQTGSFPSAIFELTGPVELPAELADGQAISITVPGNLTLHGVTQPVEMPLDVQLSNGVLVVAGSQEIALTDYGIRKPSAQSVLSVSDTGLLELQLFFAVTA